ncbi:glucose-1-phosphate adenylyltransferase subunit GlgD [Alloscardovia criceti]|uniref:glucose-1-phosphate adenylyltransferase subunit GlgD n=1 Tax=Alloscardovia criceti TaxID=356828 RepID=UPI000363F9AE|nr:glucose-1-phosphate adenylyltransferase subunit GlgD [Alloscardovia criceti]
MKLDKYNAILGNTIGYPDMEGLTAKRPMASLPFDGKYRLVDFQLSSLANAGIRSVYGIFQRDNISSIFDHVRSGREWGLDTLLSHWYLGFYNTKYGELTTDQDYYEQLLRYLKRSGSDRTVYMGCDILCNIDLEQVIHLSEINDSTITVVYKRLPTDMITEANEVLEISEDDHVIGEKVLDNTEDYYNMSAEIYVVKTDWLIERMEEEKHAEKPRKLRFLLRSLLVDNNALAFGYTGYLSNISSVKSYFDANMDMLEPVNFYSLLYSNQKVYTKVKNEEATYFSNDCETHDSQFASGSIIKGKVNRSIISRNCYVDEHASVCHTIAFSKVKIGEGAQVDYAILDKNVEVAPGVRIQGTPDAPVVIVKGTKVEGDIIR